MYTVEQLVEEGLVVRLYNFKEAIKFNKLIPFAQYPGSHLAGVYREKYPVGISFHGARYSKTERLYTTSYSHISYYIGNNNYRIVNVSEIEGSGGKVKLKVKIPKYE